MIDPPFAPAQRHCNMSNDKRIALDGFAAMADEDPFKTIKPQKPPNDPKIKGLLGRALMEPATLTPDEIQEMAASVVYHLLSQGRA